MECADITSRVSPRDPTLLELVFHLGASQLVFDIDPKVALAAAHCIEATVHRMIPEDASAAEVRTHTVDEG